MMRGQGGRKVRNPRRHLGMLNDRDINITPRNISCAEHISNRRLDVYFVTHRFRLLTLQISLCRIVRNRLQRYPITLIPYSTAPTSSGTLRLSSPAGETPSATVATAAP